MTQSPDDPDEVCKLDFEPNCDLCGDSEEIECPDCEGEGFIPQSIDDDIGVVCERCAGLCMVDCPECCG